MKINIKKSIVLLSLLGTVVLYANQPSFKKTLSFQGIAVDVTTTGEGSLRNLTITPTGLIGVNEAITQEIDGSVVDAEMADLNNDGFPEVYIYISSAGSGGYGSLVAYSSNRNKSITSIYMSPLEDDKNNSIGYMGHDMFNTTKDSLVKSFPIYKKDDANCCPTGGTRQLEYKLTAGESSWQLKLVKSTKVLNKVDVLITLATSKIGDSYVYAAAGPDHFDCSGFVYYLFKENGVSIPRSSLLQSKSGEKISREKLKKGDILFFDTHERDHINHSGVYLGEGEFIHSSSGKANGVTTSSLDKGFYKDKFRWGVRKLPK